MAPVKGTALFSIKFVIKNKARASWCDSFGSVPVSVAVREVWCRELPDGTGDPAPGHRAVVIAFGRELVGTRGALLERVLTVTLEHQGGGAPDVDLGYHAEKVCKPAV